MKKLLSLLFIMVSLLCVCSCNKEPKDDRPTLTVGMECDYAPFNWTETSKTETNVAISNISGCPLFITILRISLLSLSKYSGLLIIMFLI